MPPHLQIFDTLGDPAEPWLVAISGGEESDTLTLEIHNDKDDAFLDTTTAQDIRARLLTSFVTGIVDDIPVYSPFKAYGDPITDERWTRFRVTHVYRDGAWTTDGATGTRPIGANSEIPLPDLAPQEGVRITLKVIAPGDAVSPNGHATKVKLSIVGNVASSPLSQMVTLAYGSGVIPGDRVDGLRAFLRGGAVVADDTDTVVLERGQMVHDGATVTFLETEAIFDLEDGDAVELDADEAYLVTLSRAADGTVTVTKGPKAEAVDHPAAPADELFFARLRVYSADGIAVTVAQSDVDQTGMRFAQFLVRDGGGLSVIVEPGDGVSSSDHRQFLSHPVTVALAPSVTSQIWRLPDGSFVDTTTATAPEVGADLLALAITDTDNVTSITDARVLAHRAIVTERIVLAYTGVLSAVTLDAALAWAVLPECEIERVAADLSAADGTWTGGSVAVDVLTVAAGEPLTGGTTIFTGSATDDRRPVIAFDATNLRSVSEDHEVRRFAEGTRVYVVITDRPTVGAPEPEQEVRVTLTARRWR